MKLGLLTIEVAPFAIPPQDFESWFLEATEKVFLKTKAPAMAPMACMTSSLSGTLMVYPDFRDNAYKRESMQQIRILADVAQVMAYGFVSEGYGKEYDLPKGEDRDEFAKNIDPNISRHPNREEVLICHFEIREGGKINRSLSLWPIIDDFDTRKLGVIRKMPPFDELKGVVAGQVLF